jgi:hypothetical protein
VNLWPIARNDVALIQRAPWLVKPYVFLLSVIGLATAGWTGSAVLAALGGVFLGAAVAPLLPIWREAETDFDRVFLARARAQSFMGLSMWVLLVAVCVAAAVLAVASL